MICLIIYILMACQSTNTTYVENAGAKIELANKRGSYIDSIDNRTYDRVDNNYKKEEEQWEQKETLTNFLTLLSQEEGVKKMEDLQGIITALGSAIAGVYCLIKTIIAAIKKTKKN